MTPRDYAILSQEAYDAPPDIGIAMSASRAIVRHTGAGLCIAFRGTDDVASFAADFDIEPLSVPGVGTVYTGFWRAWEAMQLEVLAAAAGQPVTLCGHSLGAALALMAAAAMVVGGNAPVAVYGFEPPRVGVDLGIRALLARVPVHLYKNGNDIVCDVPPGGNHAALLTPIGKSALPWPNVIDHEIARVIAAFPVSTD